MKAMPIRSTLMTLVLVGASFSFFLTVSAPIASAAICTAPSCSPGGEEGCQINLGDCNGGSCNINVGQCDGGSCVVNTGGCSCYTPQGDPCPPDPGNNCGTDELSTFPPTCGCVVNAGTCNGGCTSESPPDQTCGKGGNCIVNIPTADCSGVCEGYDPNNTANQEACGNGGTCIVNLGECGGGCESTPGVDDGSGGQVGNATGCGDGGSCTINTANCDGYCEVRERPGGETEVWCSDGDDCILNTGVCRTDLVPKP